MRAGEAVTKDQPLATLDSPELNNEYQRERATLESLDAALSRQQIEIRRQIMTSQQQADLAQVAIKAAQRELDAQRSGRGTSTSSANATTSVPRTTWLTAQLNFDHARDSAQLERDSLALDLRTKRLERDRQALVVSRPQASAWRSSPCAPRWAARSPTSRSRKRPAWPPTRP